jgi:hypothetical protein
MYRQGLGDCFLLTFPGDIHIMIDCGLLAGTPGGPSKIRQVAEHIRQTTEGRLQALVVTHEHWDHVSGFSDAQAVFESLTIGETWVAWTEDPKQDIATERRKANGLRMAALRAAVVRLGETGDTQDALRGGEIVQAMNFMGGIDDAQILGFSVKTDQAMSWATDEKRNPKYLLPAQAYEPSWLPGVTVLVLGPPQDLRALKKMDGEIGTDMYGMSVGRGEMGFAAAVGVALEEKPQQWLPFDPGLQWRDEAKWLGNFDPDYAEDFRAAAWRRIDSEWLNAASELALQLDNAINNTSLVLAFEFGQNGDVLLFVGDAQVGNWKSWAEKAENLLNRTIFYKVGHHGSHNATLKEHGLEAMTNRNLVAAIPVDQTFAEAKKPIPWMMPAEVLYRNLQDKTRGRILRADRDFPRDADKPEQLSDVEWKKFQESVEVDPLFIDFFCKPNG